MNFDFYAQYEGLYRILDKLGIHGNVSVTEQIERLIYDSFDNKAFSHDPK